MHRDWFTYVLLQDALSSLSFAVSDGTKVVSAWNWRHRLSTYKSKPGLLEWTDLELEREFTSQSGSNEKILSISLRD